MGFEKLGRCAVGADEAADESDFTASFQADGGQGDDFHARDGFDGCLVHFLGGDEESGRTTAPHKLIGHRQTGEEMPTRPTTGDGHADRGLGRRGHG